MFPRNCLLLLATLASPLSFAQSHPVTCPPVIDGNCQAGALATDWCPVVPALQCPTGMGKVLMHQAEPPPSEHTDAMCDYTSGAYHCEAWPKLAGVTYSWSKFGMLSWLSPPGGNDYADIGCTPGINNRVNLTVTSPYGYSRTTTTYLYCGASGEY